MSSSILAIAYNNLVENFPALHCLFIARHGSAIFERRNPQARESPESAQVREKLAEVCGQFGTSRLTHVDQLGSLWNTRSIAKSVVSALVGIAFDRGYFQDMDECLCDLLPEAFTPDMDPRKRTITLQHLLTMTSGLQSVDAGMKPFEMLATRRWVRFMLDLPLEAIPGEKLIYNSANPHLLSAAIHKQAGIPLLEFARQHLFGRLGIEEVEWEADPQGYTFGGGNLFLSPGDMAKIGQLYLNRGQWDGVQILSPGWIEASLQRRHPFEYGFDYGFFWYLRDEIGEAGGRPVFTFSAAGIGGQKIIVIPALDLVLVSTARTDLVDDRGYFVDRMVNQYLFSAVIDEPFA